MTVKPPPSGAAPGSAPRKDASGARAEGLDGPAQDPGRPGDRAGGPRGAAQAVGPAGDAGGAGPAEGRAGGRAVAEGRATGAAEAGGAGMAEGRAGGPERASGGMSAESLASAARAAGAKGAPPVHLWNPPFCGDLDIRIARDGTWFYLGTPIGRPEMVRLFAGILRKDGEAYFLVTPVEKVGITVEDAPFVAVDFERDAAGDLVFTTNVGDVAVAGPAHPIRVERDPATGEPAPYVLIRRNLEALIDRKSFYRLVELGEEARHEGADWFGLRSGGTFFPIIPAADLPRD